MSTEPAKTIETPLELSGKDIDDAFEQTGVDLGDPSSAPKGRFIAAHQYFTLRRNGVNLPSFEEFYTNGNLATGSQLNPATDPLASSDTTSGGTNG